MKFKTWDYIIVGTGMGAGPIGLRLAQAGHSVLFLEKGLEASIRGQYAEQVAPMSAQNEAKEILKKSGRWSESILDIGLNSKNETKSSRKIVPFIGSGLGGSSALYGMVLERFTSDDIKLWPIKYSDLSEHYTAAERLFNVNAASVQNPANQSLVKAFNEEGIESYSLPLAQKREKKCGQCQGFICNCGCKQHSGNVCVESAVAHFDAELLTNCEVQKIAHNGQRAHGVQALCKGTPLFLNAKNVIVAAGALKTPLLLESSGVGTTSGQLGRNLMRHFVDLYAVKSPKKLSESVSAKEVGVKFSKDFTLQSFGYLPPAGVIASDLLKSIGATVESSSVLQAVGARWILKSIHAFLTLVMSFVRKNRVVLATILEDSPRYENRVWQENGQMKIHYKIDEKGALDIQSSRNKVKTLLNKFSTLFIASAEKNEMLAHACGTARMGTNPSTSVVDMENRVHGFSNIYVTDASFFPTSGKTNPGLTIAANSLRVAELILNKNKSTVKSIQDEVWTNKN